MYQKSFRLKRAVRETANFLTLYTGASAATRLFKAKSPTGQFVILGYHNVSDMPKSGFPYGPINGLTAPSLFEKEVKHLTASCNVIALDTLLDSMDGQKPLPKRAVIITFDDGYRDNYEYAFPILKKYNAPATIFLTTGCISDRQLLWWDKVTYLIGQTKLERLDLGQMGVFDLRSKTKKWRSIVDVRKALKTLPDTGKLAIIAKIQEQADVVIDQAVGEELYLSWDEIREMAAHQITFGAHTHSHPIMTKITPEQAENEIWTSKSIIEAKLGKATKMFSYPNGKQKDFNDGIKGLLNESGLTIAVSAVYGKNVLSKTELDVYNLKRIMVGSRGFFTFLAILRKLLD